jgi:hypothetical protein
MGESAGEGPRWGCLSQDRRSRFVVAWSFAASEDEAAPRVVEQTRARTAGRRGVPWISDGKQAYAREIRRVYRDPLHTGRPGRPRQRLRADVSLVQAVKHREGARVVEVEVRPVLGETPPLPYVVCEERLNGVLRDRLNCLTRKTHALRRRRAPGMPRWCSASSSTTGCGGIRSCSRGSPRRWRDAATGGVLRRWRSGSATISGAGRSFSTSP